MPNVRDDPTLAFAVQDGMTNENHAHARGETQVGDDDDPAATMLDHVERELAVVSQDLKIARRKLDESERARALLSEALNEANTALEIQSRKLARLAPAQGDRPKSEGRVVHDPENPVLRKAVRVLRDPRHILGRVARKARHLARRARAKLSRSPR